MKTPRKLIMKGLTYTESETWIERNEGYFEDVFEGSLIDTYFVITDDKYLMFLETYSNPWSSLHNVYEMSEDDFYDEIDQWHEAYGTFENIEDYDL